MKKTLIALTLAVASPVLLAAGPKPKAPTKVTGGVRFVSGGQQMSASFGVHAPDRRHGTRGDVKLRRFTPGGHNDIVIRVTDVTISGKVATLCGQVTISGIPADRGRWVSVIVVDGGNPGRNGDLIGLTWGASFQTVRGATLQTSRRATLQYNNPNTPPAPTAPPPAGLTPVTAGNLKVH